MNFQKPALQILVVLTVCVGFTGCSLNQINLQQRDAIKTIAVKVEPIKMLPTISHFQKEWQYKPVPSIEEVNTSQHPSALYKVFLDKNQIDVAAIEKAGIIKVLEKYTPYKVVDDSQTSDATLVVEIKSYGLGRDTRFQDVRVGTFLSVSLLAKDGTTYLFKNIPSYTYMDDRIVKMDYRRAFNDAENNRKGYEVAAETGGEDIVKYLNFQLPKQTAASSLPQ